MRRRIASCAVALAFAAGPALAQTTTPGPAPTTSPPPASSTTATAGAFSRLSPGNQKIAEALFDAQTTGADATATGAAAGTAPRTLTLDEIAAMKQGGQGWGEVFKDLRARGLVQEKNLGQVISGSKHAGDVTITTAGATGTPASPKAKAAGTSRGGTTGASHGKATTVTTGSGRTVVAGGKSGAASSVGAAGGGAGRSAVGGGTSHGGGQGGAAGSGTQGAGRAHAGKP